MKCVEVEDEVSLIPQSLGIIASFYYVSPYTVDIFAENVKPTAKLKQLLEVLSNATEYETVPMRQNEENYLKSLAAKLVFAIINLNFSEINVKVNILLQAHFSRTALTSDLNYDKKIILQSSVRLAHAMFDVINSSCLLSQAILSLQLC